MKKILESSAPRIGSSRIPKSDFSHEYVSSLKTKEDLEGAIDKIKNRINDVGNSTPGGKSTYGIRMMLQGRIMLLQNKIDNLNENNTTELNRFNQLLESRVGDVRPLIITESELHNMVKKIVNESKHDRIMYGGQISNSSNKELISQGYTPYYLDLSSDGNYKIIKVTDLKKDLPNTRFYFLDEREHGLLQRMVNNINDLISEYIKMIDLYKKQLIGVLEQKIIK